MKEELNMPLRTVILEMALQIEDYMTKLLQIFLVVDKEDTRTLSNRSSSLSFKQKIDLLYDLDVLTKEENKKLLLLMEFRNQFLHNINCNSFEIAVTALDGRGKSLLEFDDLSYESEMEFRLEHAYRKLHLVCLDVVLGKIEYRYSQVKAKRKVVTDLLDYSKLILDSDADLLSKIVITCLPEHEDNKQLADLKMSINNLINEHTNFFYESSQYLELEENIKKHLEPNQVKVFFSR